MSELKNPFELRSTIASNLTRSLPTTNESRAVNMLWLDKNECIDPAYNDFMQNLLRSIPASIMFSYPNCFALYEKLANYLQVEVGQLFLGAGSDGVIRAVYEAFVAPGDIVIHPEPTFLMYSVYGKIVGADSRVLDYQPTPQGPFLSMTTLLDAVAKYKPRLVCLPNPGSPTGTVYHQADLQWLLKLTAEIGAILLIDEAYYPIYDQTILPFLNSFPHLIITRSFSKAWGLAGIRLGYGIGSTALMAALHKVKPRYEIGALSVAVAERALNHHDEMLASVQRIIEGKHNFLSAMESLGFRTLHNEGNFLHVAFGSRANEIHTALSPHVLYQKDFKHPALIGFSRFTATTKELFSPIINIIRTVIANQPQEVLCQ